MPTARHVRVTENERSTDGAADWAKISNEIGASALVDRHECSGGSPHEQQPVEPFAAQRNQQQRSLNVGHQQVQSDLPKNALDTAGTFQNRTPYVEGGTENIVRDVTRIVHRESKQQSPGGSFFRQASLHSQTGANSPEKYIIQNLQQQQQKLATLYEKQCEKINGMHANQYSDKNSAAGANQMIHNESNPKPHLNPINSDGWCRLQQSNQVAPSYTQLNEQTARQHVHVQSNNSNGHESYNRHRHHHQYLSEPDIVTCQTKLVDTLAEQNQYSQEERPANYDASLWTARQPRQNFDPASDHDPMHRENRPQNRTSPHQHPPPHSHQRHHLGNHYYNYPPNYQYNGHCQLPPEHHRHYQALHEQHHAHYPLSHSHAHAQHSRSSPTTWQCNQCSRVYQLSVNKCAFCSEAANTSSSERQSRQRQQPHQPNLQRQYPQRHNPSYTRKSESARDTSDFQPTNSAHNGQRPIESSHARTSTSQKQYRYPEYYNPPPASQKCISPTGPRYRTKKVAQKSPRYNVITVDAMTNKDERKQNKYFQSNEAASHSNIVIPPRGKQVGALGKLLHQQSDIGELARPVNFTHGGIMSRDSGVVDRTERLHLSLDRVIEHAESLRQLEGIRHQLKSHLEKVEIKINRALVKKALDAFGSNDSQQFQVNKATAVDSSQNNEKIELCCPLCFSFKSERNVLSPDQCPICERTDVCPHCQSICADCSRSCCKNCIFRCETCCVPCCPDCKSSSVNSSASCQRCAAKVPKMSQEQTKKRKGAVKPSDKHLRAGPTLKKIKAAGANGANVVHSFSQDKTVKVAAASQKNAIAASTAISSCQIMNTTASPAHTKESRAKASQPSQDSTTQDGTTSYVQENRAPMIGTTDRASSDRTDLTPGDDTIIQSPKQHLKCTAMVAKSDTTQFLESRSSAASTSNDCAIHLITVIHEGSIGIRIGPDQNDRSYTRINVVDPNSSAEAYGLQVGDLIVNPSHDNNTAYETTKYLLMSSLKSRPTFFSVLRKCSTGNSERIYALGSEGERIPLHFNDDSRVSIHTFVIDSSNPLPFGITVEDSNSKGYNYTYIKTVQHGSLAHKHGVLIGDIFCKTTSEGRLISGLSEWIAASILKKALFRFEVIRIHKGAASHEEIVETQTNKQDTQSQSSEIQQESSSENERNKSDDDHPRPMKESPPGPTATDRKDRTAVNHDINAAPKGKSTQSKGDKMDHKIHESDKKNTADVIDLAASESDSDVMYPKPNGNIHRPLYSIGTKLQKKFFDESIGKRRYFKGQVVAYDHNEGFYRILYEDGDEEELSERQLTKLTEKGKKHEQLKLHNNLSRPLLTGRLSLSENMNPSIKGHWHFEFQPKIQSQTFELTRFSSSSDETTFDGEYSGHFFHQYKGPSCNEVKTMKIKESKVTIKFTPKEKGDVTMSIKGKGINQYGIFELEGNASQDIINGKVVYNVWLYKTYIVNAKLK